MRILLWFGAAAASAFLLSLGLTPSAPAEACLLCIWEGVRKEPVWIMVQLVNLWVALLHPFVMARYKPLLRNAPYLQQVLFQQMFQLGVDPSCVFPGFSGSRLVDG
jgi:hypothetical protein